MNEKFGPKQLIRLTVLYLLFEGFDLVITQQTGVRWVSPRDFLDLLGLVAISLLWIWHLADKSQKK